MPTATYEYRDRSGRLVYRVLRFTPKRFEIWDHAGSQLTQFPHRTVLYRLPELVKADPRAIVYIVEGEKDADRLAGLGLVATTNPGGCRVGWKPEYTTCLQGRHVVILPDNDRPGTRHSEAVSTALLGKAASVVVLKLPRLRRAEDVSDWLDFRRGTRQELTERAGRLLKRPSPGLPRGGQSKRHAVFQSRTLSASERLILLAIHHHSGEPESVTPTTLAQETALHRVTVHRVFKALEKREIISRRAGDISIDWDRIV